MVEQVHRYSASESMKRGDVRPKDLSAEQDDDDLQLALMLSLLRSSSE